MSIKNKFATAVATASLLAGLFGSAFVPSALAAGRTPAIPVVKPIVTEVYAGEAVTSASNTTAQAAGKTRTFGFYSGYNAGGDNVAQTVAGGAIEWQNAASTAAASNDDASIGFQLFSSTDNGVGDDTYDFVESNLELKATSSNSGVLVAWAYDADGEKNLSCNDLDTAGTAGATVFAASDAVKGVEPWSSESVFGSDDTYPLCLAAATATTAATSTITVTANGVTAATITVTAVGPIASIVYSAVDGANIAEDNGSVNQFWSVIAKDSAGTILNGLQGSATKAAGVSRLNLDFDHLSTNPKNQAGTNSAIVPLDGSGDAAELTAATYGAYQLFDLESDVCLQDSGLDADADAEGDADAGKSYELKVTIDATTDITSNGVTILCTGAWEGATVTSVSVDETSGGLTYENLATDDTITITGIMKDSAGRLLGAGAGSWDDEEIIFSTSGLSAVDSTVDTSWSVNGKGEFIIDEFTPTSLPSAKKYAYSLTVIVNAGAYANGDDEDAVTKKYSFIYTASDADATSIVPAVTKNAAKTKATITVECGLSDSNNTVDFDVELANGNLVTYTRSADIDGIAKLVLSKRRTTIRVQAYCTDGDSVVKTVSFK
jgi:hypothetical protein